MDAGSTWFHRELKNTLDASIERGNTALANGNAASWEDYRYRVGFQAALRMIAEECEAISSADHQRQKQEAK